MVVVTSTIVIGSNQGKPQCLPKDVRDFNRLLLELPPTSVVSPMFRMIWFPFIGHVESRKGGNGMAELEIARGGELLGAAGDVQHPEGAGGNVDYLNPNELLG